MWNESYFAISLFCALLVFMLDYSFGQPGNEKWNDSELLSGWSLLLARRRLQKDDAYEALWKQYVIQITNNESGKYDGKLLEKNFNRVVFMKAKEVFYWEKAFGMCPICFHCWVTLFLSLMVNIFYFKVNIFYSSINIFTFTLYFLLSHCFIRLLKKFL